MSQIIPIYIPTYISDQNYNPSRVLPRLLFYNGMLDSQKWYIESGSTSVGGIAKEQNAFPYFDNYNVVTGSFPTTNSDSLLFYNEQAVYGEVPTDSLYSTYWSKYVNLLYNPRTRLLNASAIIPLADYFKMELNDIVAFRGNDYHIRAINDYNLSTGECNIQLLGPILEGSLTVEQLPADCSFTFSSVDDSVMELEIFTTASNYTVGLPINYSAFQFEQVPTLFTASWGDGTITYVSGSGDGANSSHTYTSAGTYKIGLTGSLDSFTTSPNTGERSLNLVLTKVNKWGNLSATVMGFTACPVLESIPNGNVGLYNLRYINGYLSTSTAAGVPTASKLETLPSDLFKFSQGVLNATNFAQNNRNLKVVPENLFYYNPNITTMASSFFLCTEITTLPNVLFSPPPNALTSLNGTFRGTTSLTSIPNSLFDNISGSAASPKTINLSSVFRQTTTVNALTGNAPTIWSYPYLTASISTNAFTNCTGLTNYASIPAGWK